MSTMTTMPIGTPAAPALDKDSFGFVCNLVRSRSAIEIEASKAYLVESRLAPLARQQGFASLHDFVSEIRRTGKQELSRQVVEAMTTNETSFFRDAHPFDALKSDILPQLIAARSAERSLTIWSSACSSGQEAYSIAMILREHFPVLSSWKVSIVGTDLSSQIVAKARSGAFNQTEINRGLPAHLMVKYFKREGMNWVINDDLRKMVEFRELNLVEPWPASLPKMDIVFLRNVLIYFAPEMKKAILGKVRNTLRPDGFLFLGGAETTMNLDTSFQRQQIGKAVCYRRDTKG